MWTCITHRKMQNSYRRCWWDILQHRRKIVNNRGGRLCLDSIPMKVRANEDSLSRNIPKKSSFHCVFWGEGLASPKQCTHVQILHVEIRFFALIFDSLAPLSWHFCQIQPWSAMPPRVIWMQNKNLSIPPFAWHLKAIFIWTLNLLNLQLQILRYAPYRTSAIKKKPQNSWRNRFHHSCSQDFLQENENKWNHAFPSKTGGKWCLYPRKEPRVHLGWHAQ